MGKLNDMEEMIESICDVDLKEFMREAYLSYMAGAFKSSIIVSTVAVYEDLRKKTKQLSLINSDAKEITKEIEKRMSCNEVFESYLEDQLTSKKILNSIDKRNLVILRDRRNLAAHPTGHKSTAEEARFIYSVAINNFLSKPLLYANEMVDFILNSLKNENYFPSIYINDIGSIVKNAIENLHEGSYPFLIKSISVDVEEKNSNKNQRFFLYGLVNISKEIPSLENSLNKYFIETKADDLKAEIAIVTSIGINANLYILSNSITQARVKTFIINRINKSDETDLTYLLNSPIKFFELIVKIKGNNFLVTEFDLEVKRLISLYPYNIKVASLACLNSTHKDEFIIKLKINARSTTYEIANTFANRIYELDEFISNNIEAETCLTIILASLSGAEYGAFDARDLRDRMYNSIPKIKTKIKDWIALNELSAIKIIQASEFSTASCNDFIEKYLK